MLHEGGAPVVHDHPPDAGTGAGAGAGGSGPSPRAAAAGDWQVFDSSTPLSRASRALQRPAAAPGCGPGAGEDSPEKIMAAQRPCAGPKTAPAGGRRPGRLEETPGRRGTRALLAELVGLGPRAAEGGRPEHGLAKIPRAMLASPHASSAGPGRASEALSSLQPLRPVAQLPSGAPEHAKGPLGRSCRGADRDEAAQAHGDSSVCDTAGAERAAAFAIAPADQREEHRTQRPEELEHDCRAQHSLQTPTPGGPQTPSLSPSSISVASNPEEGSSAISVSECLQLAEGSRVAGEDNVLQRKSHEAGVQAEMLSWADGDVRCEGGRTHEEQTLESAEAKKEHMRKGIDVHYSRASEDFATSSSFRGSSCIEHLAHDIQDLTNKMAKRVALDGWRHLASIRQRRHVWIEKVWARSASLRNAKRIFTRWMSCAQERVNDAALQTLAVERICNQYAQDRQMKWCFFLQWRWRAHQCTTGPRLSSCSATHGAAGMSIKEAEARLRALDVEREQLIVHLQRSSGRTPENERKAEGNLQASSRDKMLLSAVRLRNANASAAAKRLTFEVWDRHTSVLSWTHGRLRLASHKSRLIAMRCSWATLLRHASHARSKRCALAKACKRGEAIVLRRVWTALLAHIINVQLQQEFALVLTSPSKTQGGETDAFSSPAQDAIHSAARLDQCRAPKSTEVHADSGRCCVGEVESCKRALFPGTDMSEGNAPGADHCEVRDLLRRQILLSQSQAALINKLRDKLDRQASNFRHRHFTTASHLEREQEQANQPHVRAQMSMSLPKQGVEVEGEKGSGVRRPTSKRGVIVEF